MRVSQFLDQGTIRALSHDDNIGFAIETANCVQGPLGGIGIKGSDCNAM
jgi:hypothetical protein